MSPPISSPPTRTYTVPPLPPRPPTGHKGTFGRILIVAGSPTMLGAPVFAATAALRAGAGLVQIATDKALLPHALTITPELIGHALNPSHDRNLLAAAEAADILLLGPGMGTTPQSRRRLLALLKLNKPTVLDADALNLLSKIKRWPQTTSPNQAPRIITPHPGEMQRLRPLLTNNKQLTTNNSLPPIPTTDEARIALATQAARTFHLTVILKGARTVITDGTQVFVNPISTTALSKAGTGDILAGLTAALLHTLPDPFQAATLATHLHAQAGLIAGNKLGNHSTLARDILDALPQAIKANPTSSSIAQ